VALVQTVVLAVMKVVTKVVGLAAKAAPAAIHEVDPADVVLAVRARVPKDAASATALNKRVHLSRVVKAVASKGAVVPVVMTTAVLAVMKIATRVGDVMTTVDQDLKVVVLAGINTHSRRVLVEIATVRSNKTVIVAVRTNHDREQKPQLLQLHKRSRDFSKSFLGGVRLNPRKILDQLIALLN